MFYFIFSHFPASFRRHPDYSISLWNLCWMSNFLLINFDSHGFSKLSITMVIFFSLKSPDYLHFVGALIKNALTISLLTNRLCVKLSEVISYLKICLWSLHSSIFFEPSQIRVPVIDIISHICSHQWGFSYQDYQFFLASSQLKTPLESLSVCTNLFMLMCSHFHIHMHFYVFMCIPVHNTCV